MEFRSSLEKSAYQATLVSILTWHPQAAKQLPLAMMDQCPHFSCGPISPCGLFFRENILLYSCLYHKGEDKGYTGFQKNGRELSHGIDDHSYTISTSASVSGQQSAHFLRPASCAPSWHLLSIHLPKAGPSSLWQEYVAKRAELAVGSSLLVLGIGVA